VPKSGQNGRKLWSFLCYNKIYVMGKPRQSFNEILCHALHESLHRYFLFFALPLYIRSYIPMYIRKQNSFYPNIFTTTLFFLSKLYSCEKLQTLLGYMDTSIYVHEVDWNSYQFLNLSTCRWDGGRGLNFVGLIFVGQSTYTHTYIHTYIHTYFKKFTLISLKYAQ
jgi:hypothetical protein